jgi:LacI family transcriptional regulator
MWEGTFVAAANVRDVAHHAGVSVGTVSNVLNRPDKVLPETVARVQASISALGFIRNDAARQLRAGRSKSVGLIVLDVRNPFFTDLARGAEDRAAEFGLSVILGNSDEDTNRETAYLDLFEEQRVHGVLVSPRGELGERLSRLRDRGIPAVLVDRSGDDDGFSSVSVDDVAGGRLAVEHLLDLGRIRIAFVAGSLGIRQVEDRLAGARAAVDSRPGATLEVIAIEGLTVLAGRAAGEQIALRPPQDRPDAVFAANDLVAMGVLQALVMQGNVRVPEQIALVGYDDIDFAAAAVVPLTSIRQPSREIGSTAMRIVLEEAADSTLPPRRIVFQPELVVRASTAS